jgi:hypothetical protein
LLGREGAAQSDTLDVYRTYNTGAAFTAAVPVSSLVSGRLAVTDDMMRAFDWDGFSEWLRSRDLRDGYVREMVSYARRFGFLLISGRLAEVERLGGSRSRMALAAFSNMSKFMGQYSRFKQLREEAGVQWNRGSSEDFFFRIYNGQEAVTGVEEWLVSLKNRLSWDVWFPIVYMTLSGLRTGEAIDSLNLIAARGLENYLNPQLLALEHFRFRETFLRRTKKAFVSILSRGLLQELEVWRVSTTYEKLRKRLLKEGMSCQFYNLRRRFATVMRMNGIETELIDLLQGRVKGSIFLQSYFRPDVTSTTERVRAVVEADEMKWLH